MKNHLQTLYDEHLVIVNAIDAGRQLRALATAHPERYDRLFRQLLIFFHLYADILHHHKEEAILFPEMDKKQELLGEGIIKEMFDNHESFRDQTRQIENFLDQHRYVQAAEKFEVYAEALLDHIAVENEEVFQIADSLFTELELERIAFRFEDVDRESGAGKKEELVQMIQGLRKELLESG